MKNLKKVLSLVLALAMALSLMTVAFAKDASDYTDYGTITNKEAVDVLTALEVIDGMGNNTFQPSGNVTRAQMAKMITIISLGNVDPTAFLGTTTDLKDINGHWAEAYIKYCYSQGIISGRGNGIFDPNANVTAAEASKMLLVAIGYNSDVQGYEGPQWAINVTRDAQMSGFYDGVSVPSNKALTRDEAAQMIYNAVDTGIVKATPNWNSETGVVTYQYIKQPDTDDLLLNTFKVTTSETTLNNTSYDKEKNEYTYTFSSAIDVGATTPSITSVTSDADYSDLFGMNVKVMWTTDKSGDVVVYGIYANKSAVMAECVVGDLDLTKISDNKVLVGSTEYKTEGTNATMFVEFNDTADLSTKVAEPTAQYYSAQLIDLDGNNKVDFIVYYPATIAKVTYVGKTNVTVDTTYGGSTLSVEDDTIYSGIAKDDYVVVTAGLDGNDVVEKLDTKFTAKVNKITKYDTSATTKAAELTVGDTAYKIADVSKDGIEAAAIGKDMTAVSYNGYLFYTDTSSTIGVDKFAMVINAEENPTGLNKHPQAELLFTDGQKKVVDVAADYKVTTNLVGKMVTFSVTDDVYTLKEANTATGTDFATNGGYDASEAYTKATGKTTSGYTVSDTAVIFSKDSKGNWIVSTGADVKKGDNTIKQAFYKVNTSTGYSAIELGVVDAEISVTNNNYAIVTSGISTVANADDEKVAELTIWTTDGAKTVTTTNAYNDVVGGTLAVAKGSVITYTDEGNNVITIDTKVAMTESAVVAYNPVANSDGEKDIQFSDGAASSGQTTVSTAVNMLIDEDTVILYIDRDGSDYTGIEGGEVRLATETSTTNKYFTNVAYNGSTNVKVLVVEVDNNFSDVTM